METVKVRLAHEFIKQEKSEAPFLGNMKTNPVFPLLFYFICGFHMFVISQAPTSL